MVGPVQADISDEEQMISYVTETGLILTCLTLISTSVKDGATKPDNGSWIAGERLKNI